VGGRTRLNAPTAVCPLVTGQRDCRLLRGLKVKENYSKSTHFTVTEDASEKAIWYASPWPPYAHTQQGLRTLPSRSRGKQNW
jgi:hypothetical protein